MRFQWLTVMALALGGLALPVRAEDAIRLFEPVPAGKIVLMPPTGRTAYSPPRALVVRAVPLIRGSLKDGEPADPSTAPAPWQVAPQITPEPTRTTPPANEWERVPPRVIRNAAR